MRHASSLLLLLLAGSAAAAPRARSGPLRLQLTAFDAPFTVRHGVEPSMRQSLDVTRSVTAASDWALDLAFEPVEEHWGRGLRGVLQAFALSTSLLLTSQLPLGDAWVHEEWHRAVMTHRGVASHDDVYDLRLFQSAIAVSHERDEDLARMKREHPRDFIRLPAAGMEAEVALSLQLQKDAFFDERSLFRDLPPVLFARLSVTSYLMLCASRDSVTETEAFNAREPEVPPRDFTGFDCNGWMYDLERTDEPYEARGPHPSGVGIDRYRTVEHVSADGQRYLRLSRNLSLLNFVSPQLAGFESFPLPGVTGARWNVGLTHELTSFGQVVDAGVFFRMGELRLFAAYHHYFNGRRAFGGLELEWVRFPVRVAGASLELSGTAMGWLQPASGRYDDAEAAPGGLLRASVAWPLAGPTSAFLEGELKSEGWVMGVLPLDASGQLRVGLSAVL